MLRCDGSMSPSIAPGGRWNEGAAGPDRPAAPLPAARVGYLTMVIAVFAVVMPGTYVAVMDVPTRAVPLTVPRALTL
jgi:hypothetical protein